MVAGAHLPGRAVSGDGVLLILQDGVVAHAGEIIVRVVVLAHVLETEAPMLVLARPGLGGAMRRRIAAALPIAARPIRTRPAILLGLDADAIEQW
jgi:hypothetical protein